MQDNYTKTSTRRPTRKDAITEEEPREEIELDEEFYRFSQLPDALFSDTVLSFKARCLYAVMFGFAWSPQRTMFAGQRTLAERLGASERSVRRGMVELRDRGWLTSRRRGPGQTMFHKLWVTPQK